jgi:hypothetical protein
METVMGNVGGVNGSSVTGYSMSDMPSGMSPDGILAYCEMQLNGLGNQTNQLIQQQETQLDEQQACDNVQTTLESFGTNGPSTVQQFQQCVQAFQQAIASLPPNDPVAASLTTQMNQMVSTYQYTAPQTLTPAQQQLLQQFQQEVLPAPFQIGAEAFEQAEYGVNLTDLQNMQQGQVGNMPSSNGGQWQATTDAVGNTASNIKANANIQMLSLQNLMGQMQQAVEQSTQMLSSENSTLLDESKNIGQ